MGVFLGSDTDKDTRLKALPPFHIDAALMATTAKDATFLHCLPASREQEMTAEVSKGSLSALWRRYGKSADTQKAVVIRCLGLG